MNETEFIVRWLWMISILIIVSIPTRSAYSAENTVYSVFQSLNMGNPGEVTHRDYYVTMGSSQGVRVGSKLEVYRRMPSYDLESQKLYKDVSFSIGELKVIHVESTAAIARLVKLNSPESTPAMITPSVLVGDVVKLK